MPAPRTITGYQHREICRLRSQDYDFKTIARIVQLTPSQVRNAWYRLTSEEREALSGQPSVTEHYRREALTRAKQALANEIALARAERHTSPPFKVSPLLW